MGKKNFMGFWVLGLFILGAAIDLGAEEKSAAQKRILFERGEKVRGQRLELVRRVLESYGGCQVIAQDNELIGLTINGRTYHDFTIIIRDEKKTILVITPDGVVNFDY